MITRRVALIAFISGIIGIVIGTIGATLFWSKFNAEFANSGFVLRTQADIVTRVAVLEHLRSGHYDDGTRLLETLLDGDLIGAGSLARDGTKFNSNTRRAVEMERQARNVSRYEPTSLS